MDKSLKNIKSKKKADDFRWIYFVLSLLSLFLSSCFFVPEQPMEGDFHPGIIVVPADTNNPPSISSISNINSDMGSRITGISFTVDESNNPGVAEEDDQTLTVSASSSNQTLIPDANITLNYTDNGAGDASNVTASINLYPVVAQIGSATITLTAIDNAGKSAQKSFGVTVTNPISDMATPQLWLKADAGIFSDAGITLATHGQSIQEWHDQSGNGRNATALGGAGTLPTFVDSGSATYNGLPVVNFDNSGTQYLENLTALAGNYPLNIFVVSNQALVQDAEVFSMNNGATNAHYYSIAAIPGTINLAQILST